VAGRGIDRSGTDVARQWRCAIADADTSLRPGGVARAALCGPGQIAGALARLGQIAGALARWDIPT